MLVNSRRNPKKEDEPYNFRCSFIIIIFGSFNAANILTAKINRPTKQVQCVAHS